MNRSVILIFLWLCLRGWAQQNNSSAAAEFRGQSNGNAGAAEVSKEPVRKLLYPGAETRVYARLMPFFSKGENRSHADIGYSSDDPEQMRRQLEDMAERGVDGVILDWYGRNNGHHDRVAQRLRDAAERHPGFEFALSEDVGAVKQCKADPTPCLIDDLRYAAKNYFSSPAYMRREGRPVVMFFGLETLPVQWERVRDSVAGQPLLVFRNSGAFQEREADGGFAWVGGSNEPRNGMEYLARFYRKYLEFGAPRHMLIFGAAYKGFDDSMAAWGKGKVVAQRCGQTWLDTFAEINRAFSSRQPLANLQLITWNDYEEGTELETGIDNCVTLSARVEGGEVQWEIGKGNQNAIDHFEVWSRRGEDAAKLIAKVDKGKRRLRLEVNSPGRYVVFVKAVGVAFVQNRVSAGVVVQ